MSHKASVEALDRAMQDLRNSNCPMGGCTILFSGDFRQILAVITSGTRADEVNASLKRSYLWPHITKCELKTNMGIVSSSKDNRQFSTDSLQIGNGVNDFIILNMVLVKNMEELTEKVYFDISNISTKTLNRFQERAILSHTNEQIDEIKILFFQNLKLHHKPIT